MKRMKSRTLDHRGFTLIELLITLAVLSFGLLGLAGLQVQIVRASSFNRDMTIATSIGADLLELAKGRGFQNLPDNETDAPILYNVIDMDGDNLLDDPHRGRFAITRRIQTLATFKKVEVTVSWKDVTGKLHNLNFSTDIAR